MALELGGDATFGEDYALSDVAVDLDNPDRVEVTIPAGQTSVTLDLQAIDDDDLEGAIPETVELKLVDTEFYAVETGAGDRAFQIFDNEVPHVTIRATDGFALENDNAGRFLVERTGPIDEELVVPFTLGGTATEGSDYEFVGEFVNLSENSIAIPAGEASVSFGVVPLADTEREGKETISIALDPNPEYGLGDRDRASVTIAEAHWTGGLEYRPIPHVNPDNGHQYLLFDDTSYGIEVLAERFGGTPARAETAADRAWLEQISSPRNRRSQFLYLPNPLFTDFSFLRTQRCGGNGRGAPIDLPGSDRLGRVPSLPVLDVTAASDRLAINVADGEKPLNFFGFEIAEPGTGDWVSTAAAYEIELFRDGERVGNLENFSPPKRGLRFLWHSLPGSVRSRRAARNHGHR